MDSLMDPMLDPMLPLPGKDSFVIYCDNGARMVYACGNHYPH